MAVGVPAFLQFFCEDAVHISRVRATDGRVKCVHFCITHCGVVAVCSPQLLMRYSDNRVICTPLINRSC